MTQADDFIRVHAPQVNSRWYPRFHVAPPVGWCNDPNGLSYFAGRYHLFYQFYPYKPQWGPMHWGHASSSDFLHWQHEPVALFPDQTYDAGGCFTGSAIVHDDNLCLLYTGHVDLPIKPNQPDRIEVQCLAKSTDGIHFHKMPQNPVIPLPKEAPTAIEHHFRDPKVWRHEGLYYAVVGAQTPAHTGQALLFSSSNLIDWNYLGVMAKARGNEGFMWECPNFAEFDGQEALILSPQGVKPEGYLYHNLHQSVAVLGNMDYAKGVFQRGEFQPLDYGFDFYAPQVLQMSADRAVFIGWMTMWESSLSESVDGWAGCMTVPRELHVKNRHIVTHPAEELKKLRLQAYPHATMDFEQVFSFAPWNQETGELEADFDLQQSEGLMLYFQDSGETLVRLEISNTGMVKLSRKNLTGEGEEERVADLQAVSAATSHTSTVHLQIYQDRSSLEIFLNHGAVVFSTRYYPQTSQRSLKFLPQAGNVRLLQGTFYTLDSAISMGTVL